MIGHDGHPSWPSPHAHVHLPTTAEVRDGLDLDPAEWTVEREDVVERAATVPDGSPGTRRDNVLRIRRTG